MCGGARREIFGERLLYDSDLSRMVGKVVVEKEVKIASCGMEMDIKIMNLFLLVQNEDCQLVILMLLHVNYMIIEIACS